MYARVSSAVFIGALTFSLFGVTAIRAAAQPPPTPPQHQHEPQTQSPPADDPAQQHDMQHMHMGDEQDMAMPRSREGSGTSWLPDETPMYAVHSQAGKWMLMAHGNAFLQYFRESGDRGSDQFGSINWFMGMADRNVGSGHLGLRGMISLEPWTIRGCGYPDLLASGELCNAETIHDRQHPHDLFMELAATYDRPIAGDVRLQLYGGAVGEPALGPTAFPHRISATPNPLAPITHHWFDSTHITFGVVTGGVYGKKWKAEASIFNGREPDEHRTNFDFGALDSWSGRGWFLPTNRWAVLRQYPVQYANHHARVAAGTEWRPANSLSVVRSQVAACPDDRQSVVIRRSVPLEPPIDAIAVEPVGVCSVVGGLRPLLVRTGRS
jgi:hypothetical protein